LEDSKEYPYVHRNINWLNFNDRKLQETADTFNRLYERLRFIAICSLNLDRHFRVWVSQLRQLMRVVKNLSEKIARRLSKSVNQLLIKVKEQQHTLKDVLFEVIGKVLDGIHFHLLNHIRLKSDFRQLAVAYYDQFFSNMFFHKYVEAIKSSDLFLKIKHLYLLVTLENQKNYGEVGMPSKTHQRFMEIIHKGQDHNLSFMDDIIKLKIADLFHKETIQDLHIVKLSRDADLYLDQELQRNRTSKICESLQQKTDGQPTRVLYDEPMLNEVLKKVRKSLRLGKMIWFLV
jgi:polyphosphate kinase